MNNDGYRLKKALMAAAITAILIPFIHQCTSASARNQRSAAAERHALTSIVRQWAAAWENNIYSIDQYRSYYHPTFHSNYKAKSGMMYDEWMADKSRKGKKTGCIKVGLSNIKVDLEDDFAAVSFIQRYVSDTYCDSGKKWLYFLKLDDRWKIVGEEQEKITRCKDRCGARGKDKQNIIVLVNQWAQAWENNVSTTDWYQSFYDRDFWSNYKAKSGMDYNQWMADKAAKGRKAQCIWVYVSKISVSVEGEFASARFLQRYVSNSYCDSGYKTLQFIKRGSNWKIIGEEQGSITKCSERCYY